MNCETGFRVPRCLVGACLSVENPRGARHWVACSCYRLHMRVVGVKRALQVSGPALWFFSNSQINCSRCGPCGVVGDATSVVQAQRQIHRVLAGHHTAGSQRTRFPIEIAALRYVSCGCVAIRGSSPFIDSGFDRRRTSHSVAASERVTP